MVTFLTGVAKNKSAKTKKRVDPSDDDVAPTVPKRKKEENLYKNFLEEKSQRESGWRLMRVGNKKQRGEVRGEEKVHEGKSDEKDSDLGKESQQIEMVRMEKERREREVEIWQEEKRKWEEEWRREELERREKERREWEEKWKKEELERRKKEKREGEEKWRKEEVERRERERKEWEEERRKEEVERRETEKREWEDERRRQDVERKEKERRELEEERRKEDVQYTESLQEDNADMMLLPSDLDWADWSLDSPTTSQARSGWQSTSFQQSSENWQSQMNEVN